MKTREFSAVAETLEFNAQLLASELDTSLARMRYISDKELQDAADVDKFNKLWTDIRENEAVITAVNDNADLYELSDCSVCVVLFEDLNSKMVIFDIQDKTKIMNKLNSKL